MAWTTPKTWSVGETLTAANFNTHIRDNENALAAATQVGRSIGAAGGLGERIYVAGQITTAAYGTLSVAVNTAYALPFVSPRGGTVDRLVFNVTTGGAAGSVARAGIYQAVSSTDIYPGSLVVDGGEFTTTGTGAKSATISQVLAPDVVYWVVVVSGTAAPTITSLGLEGLNNIWGTTSAFVSPQGRLQGSQTYGALPSTYPSSHTIQTATAGPAIAMRYSA